ncbi:unnamed protein product, partial [Meganyctiphanes norvegica]
LMLLNAVIFCMAIIWTSGAPNPGVNVDIVININGKSASGSGVEYPLGIEGSKCDADRESGNNTFLAPSGRKQACHQIANNGQQCVKRIKDNEFCSWHCKEPGTNGAKKWCFTDRSAWDY